MQSLASTGFPPRPPRAPSAYESTLWHRNAKSTQRAQRTDAQLQQVKLDVNMLRREIYELKARKQAMEVKLNARSPLYTAMDANGSIMQMISQYFELFRRGVHVFSTKHHHQQLAFVHAICDPSFTLGTTSFGQAMFMEQWRRYTQSMAQLTFTLQSVQCTYDHEVHGSVITCYTTMSGYVTRAMMEIAFPHALSNASIVATAVNQWIELPTVVRFHVLPTGKVMRYDVAIDLFRGFQPLFPGALEDLVRLFDQANVGQESMLGEGTADPKTTKTTNEKGINRHSIEYILS